MNPNPPINFKGLGAWALGLRGLVNVVEFNLLN
jgi:hypothetical protein